MAHNRVFQRFARQHITVEQFAFQLLIVAAGVWLAIVLGERTNQAELRARTHGTLRLVLQELQQDSAEMVTIVAGQEGNERVVGQFLDEMARPQPRDSVLTAALFTDWRNNETFFARRAAYNILVSNAQLQYIADDSLRLHLAELYDRDYTRLAEDGKLLDDVTQPFRTAVSDFRDPTSHRATGLAAAGTLLVSRAYRWKGTSEFYKSLLAQDLVLVSRAIAEIRSYLQ